LSENDEDDNIDVIKEELFPNLDESSQLLLHAVDVQPRPLTSVQICSSILIEHNSKLSDTEMQKDEKLARVRGQSLATIPNGSPSQGHGDDGNAAAANPGSVYAPGKVHKVDGAKVTHISKTRPAVAQKNASTAA
jgi:hypothetical protein